MFTGIIAAVGTVQSCERRGQDLHLRFATGRLDMGDVALGDSIAVNGVCLTVVAFGPQHFSADVSLESLRATTIDKWHKGRVVNLEKALRLQDRLGGHLVSGHVDGVGDITGLSEEGRSLRIDVRCQQALLPYIANKGSICIDGVSLTVTNVLEQGFALNIVPHTSQETIIPHYQVGSQVHIEVDLLARYAERLLAAKESENHAPMAGVDKATLARNGYLR